MRNVFIALAVVSAFGAGIGTTLVTTPARADAPPQLTIQQEEAAHPEIVQAVRDMRAAFSHLQGAPHDFGGNKAAAMADTRKAIHSLKKALYYRLKMDDAAIDAALGGTP